MPNVLAKLKTLISTERIFHDVVQSEECGQWFEALGEHYKGDVGLSPSGVSMFVPVLRAGVHKRIKDGKLTAFFFYITRVESTFFGTGLKTKLRPCIVLSVSECKAWAAEMKRRAGYVDEPGFKAARSGHAAHTRPRKSKGCWQSLAGDCRCI